MLISSEIPVKYLDRLGYLNDYPFIINIYRDIPKYREYYINACQNSKISFLDSGFFENWENGTDFDTSINALAEGVEIFQPMYVFSEEKFGDWEYTVEKSKEFKNFFKDKVKIATCVHGSTYDDFIKCYRALMEGDFCDLVAFSHKFAFHDEIIKNNPYLKCDNKYLELSLVRVFVVKQMLNLSSRYKKPIHLLGCNNPIEIDMLRIFDQIISADTSSPFIYGASGKSYNQMGILPDGKIHQGKNYMDRAFERLDSEDYTIIHSALCNIDINYDWLKYGCHPWVMNRE